MNGNSFVGWGASVLALAVLFGCSTSPSEKVAGATGEVASMKLTSALEAVATVYRRPDSAGAVPVLVLVNDRVVGSLRAGSYVQARICPGDRVGVMPASAAPRLVPSYQAVDVAAGQTAYLEAVVSAEGEMAASRVDMTTTRSPLEGEWTQSYLVSRYAPNCVAPVPAAMPEPVRPPPPPPAVVLERVQLQTDALFAFDRSELKDMLPEGRVTLEALARDIREKGLRVERVRITGHSDRLGVAAYNRELSMARAKTVQGFLLKNGLSVPMEVEARGSAEPVTTACRGNRATPALIACLQPDRRVVIDLLGQLERPAKR